MDYQSFRANAEKYSGVIEVTWLDSSRGNDWEFLEDVKQPEVLRIISVGWAIAGNAEALLLASSQSVITPTAKKLQILGTLTIPAAAIVEINPLVLPAPPSDMAVSEGPRPLVTQPALAPLTPADVERMPFIGSRG